MPVIPISEKISAQYNAIVNGNLPSDTKNAHDILNYLLSNMDDLKTLSTTNDGNTPISNFLSYFLYYITTLNNKLEDIPNFFLDNLALWIRELSEVFIKIKSEDKAYNNLFSLVMEVLKNPHITPSKFYFFSPALHTCKALMENLFQHPTNIDTLIVSFADIYYQINQIIWMKPEHKLEFAKELGELSLICLNQKTCHSILTLNKFSEVLGQIVRNIPLSNTIRAEIEKILPQIFENASVRIPKSELMNIAINFLRQYSNETQLQEKCISLFNLTDCADSPNLISPINNTHLTDIIKNNKATHVTSDIDVLANNSNSGTNSQNNEYFPLTSKMVTAMGLGGLTGFLNGSNQVILHIAERKNCSIGTQRLLAVTLALANSLTICTLPLIYSIAEDLAHGKNDQIVNSQKILTSIYAFLTSIVLQGINAGVHYFFPDKLTLKNIINFLPIFASIWMLANGEEGVAEYFFILSTHILTSVSISAATQALGKKAYSFFNSTHNEKCITEKDITEMKPLNTEKISVNGIVITEREAPEKTYQYISKETLDKTRKESDQLLEKLMNLQVSLTNSIKSNKNEITPKTPPKIAEEYQKIMDDKSEVLEKIKNEIDSLKKLFSFLNEDIHNQAHKLHTDKKSYLSAMEKLGNVCKLMKPKLINLKNKLSEASGYIKAKKESFAGINDIENVILNIAEYVDFLLCSVNLCLERYNIAEIAEQAEKNGAKKALANQETFNSSAAEKTYLRQHKNGAITNRACSMYSDRTRSSGSDTSETTNLISVNQY